MTTLSLDLQIADSDEEHPSLQALENWVLLALKGQKTEAELTIRLVDEAEITALNKQYRHKNKATNVLSFPAEIPEHIDLPLLGDLVICSKVVKTEAEQQGKPLNDHWAHMVIHGCLHLLGYDHIDDDESEFMEQLETRLLAEIGIANPYKPTTL